MENGVPYKKKVACPPTTKNKSCSWTLEGIQMYNNVNQKVKES
jgi:hypothetical protein